MKIKSMTKRNRFTIQRSSTRDQNIQKGFKSVHFLFLSILFLFSISAFIHATSCITHLDCSLGQVCDENSKTCRNCLTSAECLSKTFLKSTPAGGVSPWFSISMIVILISFTGVAVFYMVAYLFNSEQYKKIAFAELMQVIASFLLIAFLFGFENFQTDMVTQLENTSGAITAALMFTGTGTQAALGTISISPFDVSYAFLRKMTECAANQLKTTYENSKTIETVININIQTIVTIPGNKGFSLPLPNPLAFTSLANSAAKYEYDANELTWLTIFLYAQIAVLKFIETSMFTVFLPIGLILRSFPPTRGAGAVLVALAIGFYFVYPLTFVLLYVGGPKAVEGCNLQPAFDFSTIEKTCPLSVGGVTQMLPSAADIATTLDAAVPRLEAGMNSLRFMAFVYMLISLGVTFIFVRSTSSILGADISEIGRSMLRLL